MSKKDFVMIAQVINEMRETSIGTEAYAAAVAFANRFEREFPRFKRDVFLKACGVI